MQNSEYNGITVISRDYEIEKEKNILGKRFIVYWKCICYCGNEFSVMADSIKYGKTKSCGCLRRKVASENGKKRAKENEWLVDGDIAIGITSKSQRFFIDLEDLDNVRQYSWAITNEGYVSASIKGVRNKKILLHRLVTDADRSEIVDHKDWNKVNNCKNNLRKCSISQNNVNIRRRNDNKSGYTGVCETKYGTWRSEINFENKKHYLGTFKTKDEAILARNKAEKDLHMEYNGEINRKDFDTSAK